LGGGLLKEAVNNCITLIGKMRKLRFREVKWLVNNCTRIESRSSYIKVYLSICEYESVYVILTISHHRFIVIFFCLGVSKDYGLVRKEGRRDKWPGVCSVRLLKT
jgi:hypothetical protein